MNFKMSFDVARKNSLVDEENISFKEIRSGSVILKIDDLSPKQDYGWFYLHLSMIFNIYLFNFQELKLIFDLFDFDKDNCVSKGI